MKECEKKLVGLPKPYYKDINLIVQAKSFRQGWKAALEHFNKLFNDGTHPQDVIFAMQKELELL